MHSAPRMFLPVLLTLSLAGCATAPDGAGGESQGILPNAQPHEVYDHAEGETGVPSELLVAIGWAETHLQMIAGEAEFPGQEAAWGVMALRGDDLVEGAALAGLTVEQVRTEHAANVLAAAWLLADIADAQGVEPADLAAWASVVAEFSGIENPEAVAGYVHHEVYAALNDGITAQGIRIDPIDVTPDYPAPRTDGLRFNGDSSAIWTPSPNYNGRGGAEVDFIVIHSCEGSYSGCWGWLTNPSAGVSAHYVVNDNGSEVRQLVDEDNRAWHISASYDCANNSNVECWRNGTSMNTISVGIEHAGYASQASWDNGLIQRSAELSCGITERHNMVRDSYHIVAHGQLQPWNRTDPGPNWPWADYLNRIDVACGGDPEPEPDRYFVIDSDNANNPDARFRVVPGSGWWNSTNVAGYWGSGYLVAPTEAISDATMFQVDLPKDSLCVRVDAWWTAASDRSTTATYIGWNAQGTEVGRQTVNQQINGSRWVTLGNWRLTRGWNSILLSRWTTPGFYVVADAVRLSKGSGCN